MHWMVVYVKMVVPVFCLVIVVSATAWETGYVKEHWVACNWLEDANEELIVLQTGNYLLSLSAGEVGEGFTARATLLSAPPAAICRCGGTLVVAGGSGGLDLFNLSSGEPPIFCGSWLDGTTPSALANCSDSTFVSVSAAGTVRLFRLQELRPVCQLQLPDLYLDVRDLEVVDDTLRLLTGDRLVIVPLAAPTTGWELSLTDDWTGVHHGAGFTTLSGEERITVISEPEGVVWLEYPGKTVTVSEDTLWFFSDSGRLLFATGQGGVWTVRDSGFSCGDGTPQQMVNGAGRLMVATANGILWSLRCEEAVSGEPVWVAGGLIRRVELVDHRLLLTELNRTRLFHLHEETATAVQLLTSGGRFHLTPDGLLNVTDSSLWWDYRNNDLYINGGTLSLETGVLDGFNYHGRLVILWRDKLRLMDRYGMTLQEIPLEDAARLRRCGENLLVLTEQDRLQLFQPAADGHLVSITEVQLVDLRAAAYSAGRLFMLNPAGIWRADPAGRDPVLLLPLNGGRCLDSWGNSLAVGRVDGVLLLLRYHPGRDELGEESILEGCGRVEQVGFVDQKLVVLRSSGLIIYQQEEPAQTDRWEDSRPQQVITTPFLSEKSTDKEPALRIVPGPVVTGNYVSFELNTIMPTKVSLFNLGGQLIETLALPVSAGELTIPLRGLPAGCYFLQASGNERNEVQRFILIR